MKSSTNGTCSAEHSEYLRRLKRKKRFISFMQLAILIGFIAVWEILGRLEIINTFIIIRLPNVYKFIWWSIMRNVLIKMFLIIFI